MITTQMTEKNSNPQGLGVFYSDGLVDLFFGLALLMSGAMIYLDQIVFIGIFPAALLPAWQAWRKKTLSRIRSHTGSHIQGAVRARERGVLLGALFAGVLALVLGLGAFFAFASIPPAVLDWVSRYFMLLFGGMLAAAFVACALGLGIQRFYLYTLLTLAIFISGYFLGLSMPVLFLILGGIITFLALLVHVRFLSEYPAG